MKTPKKRNENGPKKQNIYFSSGILAKDSTLMFSEPDRRDDFRKEGILFGSFNLT